MKLLIALVLILSVSACGRIPSRIWLDLDTTGLNSGMTQDQMRRWYEICTGKSYYSTEVNFETRLVCLKAVLGT